MKFYETIETLLKSNTDYIDQEGKLLKAKIKDEVYSDSEVLMSLLLTDDKIKDTYFKTVNKMTIFLKDKFLMMISDKNFLLDSYTSYKNKIGLTDDKSLIKSNSNVVLNFPFKDCYLEGGQSKDNDKSRELFFNEVLAKDELDRLLDPKGFVNCKRVDKNGESLLTEFNIDKDDKKILKDNLLIKGNNLLALHSLKKRFAGKVKLIYIDPPYNTKTDQNTFLYNNTFKRSSWLVFMKNRLEIAKELLREDGCLIVAIDDNEQPYLGVLLREIFKNHEHHCITIVHNPRGVIGTNFSATHEYAFFVLPNGAKTIANKKIAQEDIKFSNLRNWGDDSLRTDAKNCFYPIIVKDNIIVGFGEVAEDSYHPEFQTISKDNGELWIYPIDQKGIERKWRYARQSVEDIKHLLKVKPNKDMYEIDLGKDFGVYKTVWNDKRYDSNEYGTKLIKSLVPNCPFKFPKSLWNVYDCLYSVCSQDKDAIILDFFGGSGTTAHAVLELNKQDDGNRQFIVVEQMDYIDTVTKERIKAVLKKDGSNIDFVSMELAPFNEIYKQQILKCNNTDELMSIYDEMHEKAFLDYRYDLVKELKGDKEFTDLDFSEQQRILIDILDKNQMYIPYTEIEDITYNLDQNDINRSHDFYKNVY